MKSYSGADRPAQQVQEIEITPEMVKAGATELRGEMAQDWEGAASDAERRELAERVVRAALSATNVRVIFVDKVAQ